jgi:hypothetical protein
MSIGTTNRQAHTKVLEDLWRNTISAIPADMGKLAYLASLRDPNSGLYHHYGLEAVYSAEQSDRALRQMHISVFYDWLKKPLQGQKEDLEHYFRTVEGELGTILENWKVFEPYRSYVPAEADEAGRQLFTDDLRLLMELMQRELFPPARRPVA